VTNIIANINYCGYGDLKLLGRCQGNGYALTSLRAVLV